MMTDVMSQNNLPLTPLGIKLGAGKEDFLHWILDWIPPAAHGGVEHLGGSSLLSLDRNLPGRYNYSVRPQFQNNVSEGSSVTRARLRETLCAVPSVMPCVMKSHSAIERERAIYAGTFFQRLKNCARC